MSFAYGLLKAVYVVDLGSGYLFSDRLATQRADGLFLSHTQVYTMGSESQIIFENSSNSSDAPLEEQ